MAKKNASLLMLWHMMFWDHGAHPLTQCKESIVNCRFNNTIRLRGLSV